VDNEETKYRENQGNEERAKRRGIQRERERERANEVKDGDKQENGEERGTTSGNRERIRRGGETHQQSGEG